MHLGIIAKCQINVSGGSVVDFFLFIVAPIVYGGSVFGACFVIQHFVSL